jgi:hypothetical protein
VNHSLRMLIRNVELIIEEMVMVEVGCVVAAGVFGFRIESG